MWATLLLGLLIVLLVVWGLSWRIQVQRIRQLERSKEEIQVEETLVFDFLHGLGSAFTETTIRAADLHRLIVEGAARILDAHGGALYMVDRTGVKLTPVYFSKGCPPMVEVPPHILQQAATTPVALESYLRMHAVDVGEGVIGRAWQDRQAFFVSDVAEAPELAKMRGTTLGATSLMVTPLLYGKQNMGVLALGNGPMSAPFTQSDFVVFKSIAEQSAFALYNAIVYSEANEKKRLDHDLQIAREIQRIMLPAEAPTIAGFEISGLN
ncbi:MAG: GAF domain-containing protein, partial [Verrucomicrobiota bacterium]|nr:GAF domain-containing protein [Verrucomicrobiota bacterium]